MSRSSRWFPTKNYIVKPSTLTDQCHHSSSCLQLTAASPSLPVHQLQSVSSRAQDSSFHAGLSLTFPLRTIEEIELNS